MGLERFIRHNGRKVENRTKSVNITKEQDAFLKRRNLNLSLIVRETLERLMKGETK